MAFPSTKVRKLTLYWTVIFLTLLIAGVTGFGSDSNALHKAALEHAMTLYAWVVLGVILDTAVEAAVTVYFQRKSEVSTHE